MTITDITVNGVEPDSGNVVRTYGKQIHTLVGRVADGLLDGLQLWVLTNPPDNRNTYLQGRVTPDPVVGRFIFDFAVGGSDEQVYDEPVRVTLILVTERTGEYLSRCGATTGNAVVIPDLTGLGQEAAVTFVLKGRR